MTVTFWGARGSVPTPSEQMLGYGGNTSCVSVEIDDRVLIIDAGTGIRQLGHALLDTDKEIYLLLTHLHDDHLHGFPFFAPLYEPEREIHLLSHTLDGEPWTPLALLNGVHFPVYAKTLPAHCCCIEEDVLGHLAQAGFAVDRLPLNHPGGAFGYRITDGGRSFVHMPDNELAPPDEPTTPFEAIAAFCRDADLLSHDAQYLPADLPHKRGWGHSLVSEVCNLAADANVRHLVLFHHDPNRTDAAIDALTEDARNYLTPHQIQVTAAHEGLCVEL